MNIKKNKNIFSRVMQVFICPVVWRSLVAPSGQSKEGVLAGWSLRPFGQKVLIQQFLLFFIVFVHDTHTKKKRKNNNNNKKQNQKKKTWKHKNKKTHTKNKKQQIKQPLFTLNVTSAVRSLAFNHNGQLMATGDVDGNVRILGADVEKMSSKTYWNPRTYTHKHKKNFFWLILDMRSYTPVASWASHDCDVIGVSFSFDETVVYSVGIDGKVRAKKKKKTIKKNCKTVIQANKQTNKKT